jgi:demethylmenaquinone methyltransferase/2-methoxy-6-polyprenyl-1,4-benzoquinol methylase
MLIRLLDATPDHEILDVGGGTGRVAQHFVDIVRAICVLDLSHGMLLEAKKKLAIQACRGIAERLPFRDGAFSRVVAVDSFHHFEDHEKVASEMVRVLSPGGRLVLEEPDIRRWPVKLVALAERMALMGSHFYPLKQMAGFFSGPDLKLSFYESEGMNVWLVVDKCGLS